MSAGTADLPVAEEAATTASLLGAHVERIYDVGVAGIHRLLAHLEKIQHARCIVVVAGMEGALPSVVGGLARCPIIGVPTSVGYGSNLGGFAPLLTMLNSCAPNITVVNIDNGFGAGFSAGMINNQK
jgi:NCAIR mutase (PurE)-related protein